MSSLLQYPDGVNAPEVQIWNNAAFDNGESEDSLNLKSSWWTQSLESNGSKENLSPVCEESSPVFVNSSNPTKPLQSNTNLVNSLGSNFLKIGVSKTICAFLKIIVLVSCLRFYKLIDKLRRKMLEEETREIYGLVHGQTRRSARIWALEEKARQLSLQRRTQKPPPSPSALESNQKKRRGRKRKSLLLDMGVNSVAPPLKGKCLPLACSVRIDAGEIQLKSPNWLFGQKKYEESGNAPKAAKSEIENGASQKEIDLDGYSELNCLSSVDINEEDIFQRYLAVTSVDEASGWYGGTLLGDQDEDIPFAQSFD
ncbi:hypothetical protein DKX38_030187 [Salix brachista]|uniref:Uncharacterized protein n=1 Tax=Salix brachista TaxID=2182728 RepID=A0A5N5J1A0_9ROSI|nr:hypothetical protein DKX38_030187 [Salix brachista]